MTNLPEPRPTTTHWSRRASVATVLVCGALLVPQTASAVIPAGTLALDFNSVNRDVAFEVSNCAERPGLNTSATNPIEGTHSATTGVLTPSALNDYRSPILQAVPGASQLSVRTQLVGAPRTTTPYAEAAWLQTDGTRVLLGRRLMTTALTDQSWTLPAGASERGRIELVFRTVTGNANQRVRFDTLRVSATRQATASAPSAGPVGTSGCLGEQPADLTLTPASQAVAVGASANVVAVLDNPNAKAVTLESDLVIDVASALVANASGCGIAALSPNQVVVPAGTVVPAGGCSGSIEVTSGTAASASITPATGVVTEAGSSPPSAAALVDFVTP
jgi:hypothetical protein